MKNFWAILSALLLASCSNQVMYENIQRDKQIDCMSVPQAQYEDCMEDAEKPFREYERERNEVLGNTDT